MSFKLFGTRILVKEFTKEESSDLEKTKSGIYLPKTQSPSDRLFKGDVIGVGDEVTKVKPNDVVTYDRTQTAPFKVDNETYQMIDQANLIGVDI
ncbi:MAG: hypothetical protein ACOC3V_04230 [bacterium]